MLARTLTIAFVVTLSLLSACRRDKPSGDTAVAKDTVVAPPPPDPFIVAGGKRLTLTMDSLPAEAMQALKMRYPTFVPYKPGDYPESARITYRASPEDGLSIVRANMAGSGAGAYAVAGRRGESQDVIGLIHEPRGWVARTVASSGAPPFSPWVTVSRKRREHPNGQLDAIAIKVHAPDTVYEDVYYWDSRERQFSLTSGR